MKLLPAYFKLFYGALPGGPVAKNLPCNAGDAGLIPFWGLKILYAAEQLGPQAKTTEPKTAK